MLQAPEAGRPTAPAQLPLLGGAAAATAPECVPSAAARAPLPAALPASQSLCRVYCPVATLYCLQKYDHLFQANERSGSFYLQSKVYRWVAGWVAGWAGGFKGGCVLLRIPGQLTSLAAVHCGGGASGGQPPHTYPGVFVLLPPDRCSTAAAGCCSCVWCRAKERIAQEYEEQGLPMDAPEAEGSSSSSQQQQQSGGGGGGGGAQ